MANVINFQQHLIGKTNSLQTVEFADVLKGVQATNLYLTVSRKGDVRLSVESAVKDEEGDPKRLIIKLGKSVVLTEQDQMGKIRELVNNYDIYTGELETEEGNTIRWFSFGAKSGELTEAVKISVADFMASMKTAATAKA